MVTASVARSAVVHFPRGRRDDGDRIEHEHCGYRRRRFPQAPWTWVNLLGLAGSAVKTRHGLKKMSKGNRLMREAKGDGSGPMDRATFQLGLDEHEAGSDEAIMGGATAYGSTVGLTAAALGASAPIVAGPSLAVAGLQRPDSRGKKPFGQDPNTPVCLTFRSKIVISERCYPRSRSPSQGSSQRAFTRQGRSTDSPRRAQAFYLAGSGATLGTAGAIMTSMAVVGSGAAVTASAVVLSGGIVAGVAAAIGLGLGAYKIGQFLYKYGNSGRQSFQRDTQCQETSGRRKE